MKLALYNGALGKNTSFCPINDKRLRKIFKDKGFQTSKKMGGILIYFD
tara:strand:- start:150 stop:293 length:144 start_codon:yes stop_codon:yes gene_type:complete